MIAHERANARIQMVRRRVPKDARGRIKVRYVLCQPAAELVREKYASRRISASERVLRASKGLQHLGTALVHDLAAQNDVVATPAPSSWKRLGVAQESINVSLVAPLARCDGKEDEKDEMIVAAAEDSTNAHAADIGTSGGRSESKTSKLKSVASKLTAVRAVTTFRVDDISSASPENSHWEALDW